MDRQESEDLGDVQEEKQQSTAADAEEAVADEQEDSGEDLGLSSEPDEQPKPAAAAEQRSTPQPKRASSASMSFTADGSTADIEQPEASAPAGGAKRPVAKPPPQRPSPSASLSMTADIEHSEPAPAAATKAKTPPPRASPSASMSIDYSEPSSAPAAATKAKTPPPRASPSASMSIDYSEPSSAPAAKVKPPPQRASPSASMSMTADIEHSEPPTPTPKGKPAGTPPRASGAGSAAADSMFESMAEDPPASSTPRASKRPTPQGSARGTPTPSVRGSTAGSVRASASKPPRPAAPASTAGTSIAATEEVGGQSYEDEGFENDASTSQVAGRRDSATGRSSVVGSRRASATGRSSVVGGGSRRASASGGGNNGVYNRDATASASGLGDADEDAYSEDVAEDDEEGPDELQVPATAQKQRTPPASTQARPSSAIQRSSSAKERPYTPASERYSEADEDEEGQEGKSTHSSQARQTIQRQNSSGSARPPRPLSAASSTEGAIQAVAYASRRLQSSGGGSAQHPASGSPQQRPASAGPRDRQGAASSDLTRRDPSTWDVRDVCLWIELIGFGQYRRKFAHHQVDGPLLLDMDMETLKSEIQIGPLGHRTAMLNSIKELRTEHEQAASPSSPGGGGFRPASAPSHARSASAARTRGAVSASRQEFPRRPASASPGVIPQDAYLGPASGKVTVYEQRAKLLYELDRAAQRAAQQRALVEQLSHTATLTTQEEARLRAELQALERRNKIAMRHSTGALTSDGYAAWRPNGPQVGGQVTGETIPGLPYARPGEDPSLDMTFKPKISAGSNKILNETYGAKDSGAVGSKFLDRLEADARRREAKKREMERAFYGGVGSPQRPGSASDLGFLSTYFHEKRILESGKLSDMSSEDADDAINSIFESKGEEWQVPEGQLKHILTLRGPPKYKAAAGAVRTMLFMARYESDLRQKPDRLKQLEKKWWEQVMGPASGREDADLAQAAQFFALLGWGPSEEGWESSMTEDRLTNVVKRALVYKAAYVKWYDSVRDRPGGAAAAGTPVITINWREAMGGSDGLDQLQDAEMSRSSNANEAAAPRPNAVTTPHAPEGTMAVTPLGEVGLDYLTYTVKLMSTMRQDDLEKIQRIGDHRVKALAVYRAIRTQKFLEFTEAKIKQRENNLRQTYDSMLPQRKTLSRLQQDAFFERLMDDAQVRRAKFEKMMHEKMAKESQILASSAMFKTRPRSAR